jgi:hypothetical protein
MVVTMKKLHQKAIIISLLFHIIRMEFVWILQILIRVINNIPIAILKVIVQKLVGPQKNLPKTYVVFVARVV